MVIQDRLTITSQENNFKINMKKIYVLHRISASGILVVRFLYQMEANHNIKHNMYHI